MSKSSNVKVFCRIRPENEKEHSSGLGLCLEPTSENSLKIIIDNLSINTGLKENYMKNLPKILLLIKSSLVIQHKVPYLKKLQNH